MQEQGKRIPVLDAAPAVAPEALPYWTAYQTLNSMRLSTSSGPQPLQFSEIRAYIEFMGHSFGEEADDLFSVIRAMDACFLAYSREQRVKAEKASADSQAASSRAARRRR